MIQPLISLDRLPVQARGEVVQIGSQGLYRRRILDLGFVPSSIIEKVRVSPLGDPLLFRVRDTLIALRSLEAEQILIRPLEGGKEP